MHDSADTQELTLTPSVAQLDLLEPARSPWRARRRLRPPGWENVLRWLFATWEVFRMGGVSVRVHFSCFVYPVGFLFWVFREGGWWWILLGTGIFVLLLWGSLLAHEWAHILVARWFGVGARRIILTPVGALAELDSMPCGLAEFWVALAGPVCSGILAAVFVGIHRIIPLSLDSWLGDLAWLSLIGFVINASLAVFNLLPCYPMDGGRMLRALLAVTLAKCLRRRRERMHLLASRIVVRYVVPVIVVTIAAITIFLTHIWLHLLLFAFLWLAAELEYWVLRDEVQNSASEEGARYQPELPGLVLRSATEVDGRAGSVQDSRRLRADAAKPFGGESPETLAP